MFTWSITDVSFWGLNLIRQFFYALQDSFSNTFLILYKDWASTGGAMLQDLYDLLVLQVLQDL